jgi:hypothetical protein
MELDRLDPDGSIRPEADLAKLQTEYQGVPETAADLLAAEFGSRLHSAYLYGSIARGAEDALDQALLEASNTDGRAP